MIASSTKRTQTRSKKQQPQRDWSRDFADGGITQTPLNEELTDSMLSYIDYTLTARAIPYIDGLKPVHRAILWWMWQNHARSTDGYKKALAIAGGTISSLHPHSGDASYLASAGMTRANADDSKCGACQLNLSLIDGHGNFGASFEDSPASPRYTEQRLSKNGEACIKDTTNGAMFMLPSFDAKNALPEVLPVRLPLLLINGSIGFAYGYNVSWLPHNPSEAIKAVIKRIDNPKCTVDDILVIMPGPDFPSGGIVIDTQEESRSIKSGYETGISVLTLTSRYTIQELSRGRHAIDIYQTPFGVNRSGDSSIVQGIMAFSQKYPEYGITDVKNLSGGDDECLIEVTIKSGINPNQVADALISRAAKTKLTQSISYRQSAVIGTYERSDTPDYTGRKNMLRLTSPRPTDLSMLEYMDDFIDFRRACIINSSEYELQQAKDKIHLIDGMLQALIDIDEVISTIRHSQNKDTAKTNLKKKFSLDDIQADYILSIPLSRLTRSDKIQLEGNKNTLTSRIDELTELLSSDKNIKAEIKRQLKELLKQQTLPRRTTIIDANGNVIAKAAADTDVSIKQALHSAKVINSNNEVAPTKAKTEVVAAPKIEGNTNIYMDANGNVWQAKSSKAQGYIRMLNTIDLNATVLIAFEDGSSIRMKTYELPTKPSILQHKAVGIVPLNAKQDDLIALIADNGKVKVLDCGTLTKSSECSIIKLDPTAKLCDARLAGNKDMQFVYITSDAKILTFPVSSVSSQGRTSAGVAGIKLSNNKIVYAGIAEPDSLVLTSTSKSAKITPLSEYPVKGRGTGGMRCQKFLKGETAISFAAVNVGLVPVDASGNDIEYAIGKRDASGNIKQSVSAYRI